jgi:hypothetical protein
MHRNTSQFAGALRTEVISKREPVDRLDKYGDNI